MATLIKEIQEIDRFGNPASLLLLNSPHLTFQHPEHEVEGLIGYQLVGNCAVVIGDPLCAPQDMPKLAQAFDAHCKTIRTPVIYLLVSEAFAHATHGHETLLQVGDQLVLDPTGFQMKQKMRWKIHQSHEQGVVVKEYEHFNPEIENQLKEAMQKWVEGKRGPQIYLRTFDFFEGYEKKRIFFAEQAGQMIGILMILYLAPSNGWVVTSLFALPGAPVGVTEHLMSQAIHALFEENCRYLCLGFSAAGIGEMAGISPFSQCLIKWTYALSNWLFHLDSKRAYFDKYHPIYYPTYILCSEKLGLKELLAIKTIFNVKL
jgi:lysylphosphatidylglycerol synthetase-like protein (DUF2156 family)